MTVTGTFDSEMRCGDDSQREENNCSSPIPSLGPKWRNSLSTSQRSITDSTSESFRVDDFGLMRRQEVYIPVPRQSTT
jgi:hypothetical protein